MKVIESHLVRCKFKYTLAMSFKKPEFRMPVPKESIHFREQLEFAMSNANSAKKGSIQSNTPNTFEKFRASFDMPI